MSKKLPPLLPEQDKAFVHTEITTGPEITCAAYEPRYQLRGLGSVDGYLYISNQKGDTFRSKYSIRTPLCVLLACVNSSSFLSVTSTALFEAHPSYELSKKNPTLSKFSAQKVTPNKTLFVHWIAQPDSIVFRRIEINYVVTAVTMSPSHPQFALIADDKGSIYGFSIQDLKLTPLYFNQFEGKLLTALHCCRGLDYYVCHDTIEKLNIKSLEIFDYANMHVKSLDVVGDYGAAINEKGFPCLLYKGKIKSTITIPEGMKCIYTQIISGSSWIAIVRGELGDQLYVDGALKAEFIDDFFVPALLSHYDSPYLRKVSLRTEIITIKGKLTQFGKNPISRHLFHPRYSNITHAYPRSPEGIYLIEQSETSVTIHWITIATYIGNATYPNSKLIHGKSNSFILLSADNLTLNVVYPEMKTNDVIMQFDSPIAKIQKAQNFIDFVSQENQVYSIPLNSDSWTFIDRNLPTIPPNIHHWLKPSQSDNKDIIQLNENNDFLYGKIKTNACKKTCKVLLLESLSETGHPSDTPDYVLMVNNEKAILFDPIKLKVLKKVKFSNEIQDASITPWGTILIRTTNVVEHLALPNIGLDSLGRLTIGKSASSILINQTGTIMFEDDSLFVYLNEIPTSDNIYDENSPALEEPEIKHFFSVEKKEPIQSVNETFQFKPKKVESGMSETADIMQQMLVIAQQRSEQLLEMQNKAEQIAESAKQFMNMCRQFKK